MLRFYQAFILSGFAIALATSVAGRAGSATAATAPAVLEGSVIARAAAIPLPGARVVLKTPAGRFETLTDAEGYFRFETVAPAENCVVTAEHGGFLPASVEGVRILAGDRRVIDIFIDLEPVKQSIQVEEGAIPVRTDSPEISRRLPATELQGLPSNGRSVTRFALLDPHVRQTQGLGSDGAIASRLSINASSFRHTAHLLDGSANYDVVFANAPQQSVSVSAVEEMKVLTNQYSAEFGGSTAGIIAVTTRSGGDSYHGEAFGFLRPSGIQAKPPLSALRAPNQRAQYGAALGGPLARGRTNFFANFEQTAQSRGSFIQSPAPRSFTGHLDEWTSLARIDHRPNDRHAVTVRLNGQHSQNDNTNDRIGAFTQPSALQISYAQAAAAQFSYRALLDRALNEIRVSYAAYTPSATRTPSPAVSIVRPSYSIEGGSTNSWVHARAAAVSELFGVHIGAHDIRAGGDLQRQQVKDYSFSPFGEYRFAAAPPAPGQQPLQFTQTFGEAMLRYGQSYGSAFFQDDWKVSDRVTANLGLRYEKQSITQDGDNLAPRAGLAWDVGGDGRTVLRAGAGVFYDQYYFYITRRFFLQGVASPTLTATIPFGAAGFPAFPASLAAIPPGADAAKRDLYLPARTLLNPYSLQYSLGIRRDLGRDWIVTADAIHTHTLKQMRANDLNAPAPFLRTLPGQRRTIAQADATRPFSTWAGVPVRNVLQIENSAASLYDALDIGIAKQFSRTCGLQVNYLYSSSTAYAMFFGEPNTGIPNDWSNTGSAERGPSDFHQRHRVVATSSVELAHVARLAIVGNFGSGLPVNPLTGLDNNGDTFMFDRPAGMGRNSFRGPAQAAVDAAISRRVKIAEPFALELRAEAFNILNKNNYLKLNGIYGDARTPGSLFLTPIAGLQNTDPSRQLQAGLKLTW